MLFGQSLKRALPIVAIGAISIFAGTGAAAAVDADAATPRHSANVAACSTVDVQDDIEISSLTFTQFPTTGADVTAKLVTRNCTDHVKVGIATVEDFNVFIPGGGGLRCDALSRVPPFHTFAPYETFTQTFNYKVYPTCRGIASLRVEIQDSVVPGRRTVTSKIEKSYP
jgi:hypothetical protein